MNEHGYWASVLYMTMLKGEFPDGLIYGITLSIVVVVSVFIIGLREDKKAIDDLISKKRAVYKRGKKMSTYIS